LELKQEIDKVKRRRDEREFEKQMWEEERMRMAREREASSYGDWEEKEMQFHLQQAKIRSEIRIKEGRPKPIDILYKSLNNDTEFFDFEMNEPYDIFSDLTLKETEELKDDIEMYLELDSHKDLWQAMMTVCEDELVTAKKREQGDEVRVYDHSFQSSLLFSVLTMR